MWFSFYRSIFQPSWFFSPDSVDYAQMGRQVFRGEGFTSLQTFPYVLQFLADCGLSTEPPWPNTTRFPLISIVHALSFSLVGATAAGVALSGGLYLVATAMVGFRLAWRLFGLPAGLLAVAWFLTDYSQLRLSVSGLLETGAAFFLVATTALLALCGSRQEGGPPHEASSSPWGYVSAFLFGISHGWTK